VKPLAGERTPPGARLLVVARHHVRTPGSTLGPEALLDFCTERMAHFTVPRYLRFVDSLHKSHAQRILKQELTAEGIEADGVWDRETVGYKVRR
jgi:crotonobetaine/carnitine-CoA ligase